ncbi:uncharacterized protein LOC107793250 [Nicotiana tabacum]|uniref:Uncharacterized protein LOC107793250 n=2 Tax=Nicotiana TaxID=4085 RepID=A0A1S4A348_TOBAC|nr:PREDICTED: uncharacterized protein LOC104216058 [Nicotiana sylvestris]XP_016471058.1 PREDICTED: uncharacterized protein LOC107793250 [Nicotiana tabacum]
MLARIIGIRVYGVKNLHIFSIYTFRFLHANTTITTTSTHFLVDFLVNSLGFSREEAVTTSNKVTRSKPPKNPDFVINFFEKNGFDNTQIKNIVSKSPKVLFSNVDKTLKPKLEILQEIGFSGSDLVKFANANIHIFDRGVDTFLRPSLEYLRTLLGSDEDVVKVIKKTSWLLSSNAPKIMAPNVLLLQNIGFSDLKLRKFILHHPRTMMRKTEWLEDVVHRVETDFGIPRESAMFVHGISAVSSFSKSTLAEKVDVYRSFGWSDAHINTMARKLPFCFCLSEAKIRKQLTFLMKEVGCTSEYLASRPKLLMYSLEKRVIPRYKVLKILHGKRLNSGLGLYSAACMTPSTFMKEVVLPYKDKLPLLYGSCMKSVQ